MTQKEALNFAKGLNAAIRDDDSEKFVELLTEKPTGEVFEFVKSALNTYIDVHTPFHKQEQDFVKNWQDSHGDKTVLDFGPANEPANEDEDFQDDEGDSPIIININIDKLIW